MCFLSILKLNLNQKITCQLKKVLGAQRRVVVVLKPKHFFDHPSKNQPETSNKSSSPPIKQTKKRLTLSREELKKRNWDFMDRRICQGTSSGSLLWSCGTALLASSSLDRSVSTSLDHHSLLPSHKTHALGPAFSCTVSSQIHSPRKPRASRIESCICTYRTTSIPCSKF